MAIDSRPHSRAEQIFLQVALPQGAGAQAAPQPRAAAPVQQPAPVQQVQPPRPAAVSKPAGRQVTAQYDFAPQEAGELRFRKVRARVHVGGRVYIVVRECAHAPWVFQGGVSSVSSQLYHQRQTPIIPRTHICPDSLARAFRFITISS